MTRAYFGRLRLRLAVVGLLAAALLSGCGSDASQTTTTSEPEPAAQSTPTIAPPHIKSPENGDVIAATAELGDTRGAKVAVTGTAQPNETIQIGSGCPAPNCSSVATVDQDGKFSGEVSVSTSEDAHRVTITIADSQANSDRVIVTIGGEAPTKNSRPPRTPRAKRRSNRPRSTATALPSVTVVPPVATPAPQVTSAPPSSGSSSGTVVVIGDSLAQGMQPYMASALPGWKVSVSARIGRPLAEGMTIFNSSQIQPGAVYAFSLFTNDDPRSVGALEAAVKDSVKRGGCAVWATIVRPALNGVSYDAANQKLAQLKSALGSRLQLVDWAAAVRAHPGWVPGLDGVHASPEGYRNRAALYAQAISNCR